MSNEHIIYRYVSDFEPYQWSEGRAAVQLRVWARLLFVTKGVHCEGREVSHVVGDQIISNRSFLHEIFENRSKIQRCPDDWHPEDHALYPGESLEAKNDEFFPAVIELLKRHKLPHEETHLFNKKS